MHTPGESKLNVPARERRALEALIDLAVAQFKEWPCVTSRSNVELALNDYLAEHSAEVSLLAWRLQDAARELIEEE